MEKESNLPISDMHVFIGDQILVSDANGGVEIGKVGPDMKMSLSHLTIADTTLSFSCGDTIKLTTLILAFSEIEIASSLSRVDRQKIIRRIKKTIKKLSITRYSGIAENSVYHYGRLSEYKNFVFNYNQGQGGLSDVRCVNAFQHQKKDSIRYFENPHRFLSVVDVGAKSRNRNSWLFSFLFQNKTWEFNFSIEQPDGTKVYSFVRENDEEIQIEFDEDFMRSLTFVNPPALLPKIELNNQKATRARASVNLEFQREDAATVTVRMMDGYLDIERGKLTVNFNAQLGDHNLLREPIFPSQENLLKDYIQYLFLSVDKTLLPYNKIQLANKKQIEEFVTETNPELPSSLLTFHGIHRLTDSIELDTSLNYNEPIIIRRAAHTYLTDYFSLRPIAGVYPLVYHDYANSEIKMKLYFDPTTTSFLEFVDSDYNEKWLAIQQDHIRDLNRRLNTYLQARLEIDFSRDQISDEKWSTIEDDLTMMVSQFLTSALYANFRKLRIGQWQNRRLEGYSRWSHFE